MPCDCKLVVFIVRWNLSLLAKVLHPSRSPIRRHKLYQKRRVAAGQSLVSAFPSKLGHQISKCSKPNSSKYCKKVNAARRKKGQELIEKTAVWRYAKGETHVRGQKEKRGRKASLLQKDVKKLDKVRKQMVKKADSAKRVTYADIQKKAGLAKKCSLRTIEDALRAEGVGYKAPRRKVYLSEADAKVRLSVAEKWIRRPTSYWTEKVHAYVDNKAFPLPLTAKQRHKFAQTRITGHLRKPSEGVEKGFTKPRTEHSWLGIPSVNVTAAVAKDKIILWHVHDKPWNGSTAAETYKGPVLTALKKTWGAMPAYNIVEDGDRKGNQSGKGLRAKLEAKIRTQTLPPRSPCWMPLDYAVWTEIGRAMMKTAPRHHGRESKVVHVKRSRKATMSLPRGFVKKTVKRMRSNIQGVIDANGFHAKSD